MSIYVKEVTELHLENETKVECFILIIKNKINIKIRMIKCSMFEIRQLKKDINYFFIYLIMI